MNAPSTASPPITPGDKFDPELVAPAPAARFANVERLMHSPALHDDSASPSAPNSDTSSACRKLHVVDEVEQEMATSPASPLIVLVRSSAPPPQNVVPGRQTHLSFPVSRDFCVDPRGLL